LLGDELNTLASWYERLSQYPWRQPTETPIWSGGSSPPDLLLLSDGRILCTYGHRRAPYGVRACLSQDGGGSWDLKNEIVIRDDRLDRDIGKHLDSWGVWTSAQIGYATTHLTETRRYVDTVMRILRDEPESWFGADFLAWYAQVPGTNLASDHDSQASRCCNSSVRGSTKGSETGLAGSQSGPREGMVRVPGGPFLRGSAPMDGSGEPEERPQRLIYLETFYIDRHPVTNGEYQRFVRETGHRAPPHWQHGEIPSSQEMHPVVLVDWSDAAAYAAWAGKRLPTEAEWQKAARGGLSLPRDGGPDSRNPAPGRRYPWGDQFDPSRCATSDGHIWTSTPVGQYSPEGDSPYGVADMAGNVWEWTADWYDPTYYQASPERNPRGPEDGVQKALRGGAAGSRGRYARCACRCALNPHRVFRTNGFRCAWTPG